MTLLIAAILTIGSVITGISKTIGNVATSVLTISWNFISTNIDKIIYLSLFFPAYYLISSLLGYILYHISLSVIIFLSPFCTEFTCRTIISFILGFGMLVITKFIISPLKN